MTVIITRKNINDLYSSLGTNTNTKETGKHWVIIVITRISWPQSEYILSFSFWERLTNSYNILIYPIHGIRHVTHTHKYTVIGGVS